MYESSDFLPIVFGCILLWGDIKDKSEKSSENRENNEVVSFLIQDINQAS